MQLRRDVKPKLDDAGIKLLMVSIGTASSGEEFARGTDFPAESAVASAPCELLSVLAAADSAGGISGWPAWQLAGMAVVALIIASFAIGSVQR